MDNETLNRLLDNPLLFILGTLATIIGGGAYFVYRFVPSKKKSTGEYIKAKPTDLIEVIHQLSKSQAMMSELLARYPELLNPPIDDKW